MSGEWMKLGLFHNKTSGQCLVIGQLGIACTDMRAQNGTSAPSVFTYQFITHDHDHKTTKSTKVDKDKRQDRIGNKQAQQM